MTANCKDKANLKKKILKPRRRIGTDHFELQTQDKALSKGSQNVAQKLLNSQDKASQQE